VILADSATFPRDKTCGDGLTPRAMAELDRLGLGEWTRGRAENRGLRLSGFGQELQLEWPGGSLPVVGSAVPRAELDDRIRRVAVESGAAMVEGAKAVGVERRGNAVTSVVFDGGDEIRCDKLVVADGVRSSLGKQLGRQWHRDTVFGVAARAYIGSERSNEEWISSHLELRDGNGTLQPGYGWIFPLGTGEVNIGVGTLATAKRPANGSLRPLLDLYTDQRRADWALTGDLRAVASALLPMGGAVSNVAGANWALIGDAAGCVNPLNGEGIDYGLETGRMVADLIAGLGPDAAGMSTAWPAILREHYGEAFSIARRLAGLVTVPWVLPRFGPAGMRSDLLMTLALRWMGNLVTEEDRDRAARVWRWAGRRSLAVDSRPPFS